MENCRRPDTSTSLGIYVAVALALLAGCASPGRPGDGDPDEPMERVITDPAGVPAPIPGDVGSPEAVVAAVDDAISGPADEERDWNRFRSLFLPGSRLMITRWQLPDGRVEEAARQTDVEGFIEVAGANYRQDGFWEREI